jgi:hypothetical protein
MKFWVLMTQSTKMIQLSITLFCRAQILHDDSLSTLKEVIDNEVFWFQNGNPKLIPS